jgi:hypothetical protein
MRIITLLLLLSMIYLPASAQEFLQGKITERNSTKVLMSVTIHNITANTYTSSDMGGFFKIMAAKNDQITFSMDGYFTFTLTVTTKSLYEDNKITLEPAGNMLDSVTVISRYRMDSINRRNEYASLYKRPQSKVTGGNTPVGFGVNFSPFTYFSRQEKQRRDMKKRLKQEDEASYVDYRFSPEQVARVTTLKGDSLNTFMNAYRPSYSFSRKASTDEMKNYIINAYNDFLKSLRQKTQSLKPQS